MSNDERTNAAWERRHPCRRVPKTRISPAGMPALPGGSIRHSTFVIRISLRRPNILKQVREVLRRQSRFQALRHQRLALALHLRNFRAVDDIFFAEGLA